MILEIAHLSIKPELAHRFEATFQKASSILSASQGYIRHELKKCIEKDHQYVLLVEWNTIEDHEIGFRKSARYQEWEKLLHHYYDPFPEVLHYQ